MAAGLYRHVVYMHQHHSVEGSYLNQSGGVVLPRVGVGSPFDVEPDECFVQHPGQRVVRLLPVYYTRSNP
jgi:hypothetical protein